MVRNMVSQIGDCSGSDDMDWDADATAAAGGGGGAKGRTLGKAHDKQQRRRQQRMLRSEGKGGLKGKSKKELEKMLALQELSDSLGLSIFTL